MSGLTYPGDVALGFRSRIEHAAYPLLERVNRLPLVATLLGLLALVVIGLVLPRPFGGLALAIVALFMGLLLFVTWPRLAMPERMMRIAFMTIALALALVRTVPGSAG